MPAAGKWVIMALLQPVLAARLASVLGRPSDNAAAKAQEWASAYQLYAATAMAGLLVPVFVGVEDQRFKAMLIPAFQNSRGTNVQFARAIADAVEAFWLLPPVPFFFGMMAGLVTSFPGKEALVGALLSALGTQYSTSEAVAQAIATALDIGTRTVIVTFAPPPGSQATLV